RSSGMTVTGLAIESCINALRDAGLKAEDVNGLGGASPPNAMDVAEGVGIPQMSWYCNFAYGPAAVTGLIEGVSAVASGMCDTALVYRSIVRPRPSKLPPVVQAAMASSAAMWPEAPFRAPYGANNILSWASMWMRRFMHETGVTPEQLGNISVTLRKHASMNERAVMRDLITIDDYLASRFIAEPLRLLDCDFPVDGAGAVVLVPAERARDFPHPPVLVAAANFGVGPRPNWEQWDDMRNQASKYAAERLWAMSGLSPGDVDVAGLYDGFTYLTALWIADLGLCKLDELGDFIGGDSIGLGGKLPLNTSGGQLSEGRIHGIGLINEVVLQLRGQCGQRQVQGAEVGVASNGGGPLAGAVVFRRG
ncbi:MAG: thiolase family protein, partial [Chloroflexi bacterium]|nr:thiolase family protein [Chloroflexota bacterium]